MKIMGFVRSLLCLLALIAIAFAFSMSPVYSASKCAANETEVTPGTNATGMTATSTHSCTPRTLAVA